MIEIDMTSIGHIVILGGVAAAYLKSKNVENLIEIQQETIKTLKEGFEACKERLSQLEKQVNSKE